jgi:hypothetical protein
MGKIPWWVWGGLAIGAGYILYRTLQKVPAAVNAATGAVSQGIADLWLSLPLVGLPANMTVLGSAQLPDGTLVPLKTLQSGQIRNDPNNNVLANINGSIYQLSPSNPQGNYPAIFIGAAPAGS